MHFRNYGTDFYYDYRKDNLIFENDTEYLKYKLSCSDNDLITGKSPIDVIARLDKTKMLNKIRSNNKSSTENFPISDLIVCDNFGMVVHIGIYKEKYWGTFVKMYENGILGCNHKHILDNQERAYYTDINLWREETWRRIKSDYYSLYSLNLVSDNNYCCFRCFTSEIRVKIEFNKICDISYSKGL